MNDSSILMFENDYIFRIPLGYKIGTLNHPPSDWNLQSRYSGHSEDSYPHRTCNTDLQSSLTVVFKVLKDDLDYLCSGGPQGFTASLHPPNEGPQILKRFSYVPLQQTTLISVEPIRTRTLKTAHGNDLSVRQCYLDAERQLRFYKQYTKHNCRTECLTNFTLAQCGCVSFSMPRTSNRIDFCFMNTLNEVIIPFF